MYESLAGVCASEIDADVCRELSFTIEMTTKMGIHIVLIKYSQF